MSDDDGGVIKLMVNCTASIECMYACVVECVCVEREGGR